MISGPKTPKVEFPRARPELPPDLAELVRRIAAGWANHPDRPRVRQDVLAHWEQLADAWCADPCLPLLVRKFKDNRGHVIPHPSGRLVVPCDNSPAHWAFAKAVLGEKPDIHDIRQELAKNRIPVAMMFGKRERENALYTCALKDVVSPNAGGWKVGHIAAVGLSKRTPLTQFPENTLREHFRQLIVPRNMFLVPMAYAGLAELPEMCVAMSSVSSAALGEAATSGDD